MKFLKTTSGKLVKVGSTFLRTPDAIKVVPGGTATGVTVTHYSSSDESLLKQELVSGGETGGFVSNACLLNITGTAPGTIILDVSGLGAVGDSIKIMHKKQDNSWETLYDGAIPSNKRVTVTVTAFSPFVGFKYDYLTFEAVEATDIAFSITGELATTPVMYYSINNGNWSEYTFGTVLSLSVGDKCRWKGNNTTFSESFSKYIKFTSSGKVRASGDLVGSLIDGTQTSGILPSYCFLRLFLNCATLLTAPKLTATTLADYCYEQMFMKCVSLEEAPKLPATNLAVYCYAEMFSGCSSLTILPQLPATTLANSCYYSLFRGCVSIISAPELPATTLANSCYQYMFYGCTSLTSAPQLPATTLANSCYQYMFQDCTSLTSAPQLPATTLANSCYSAMFQDCTSLTTAPQLPAMTLARFCYYSLFRGCVSIISAPELPAMTLVDNCYRYMFYGCTSLTSAPQLPAMTLVDNCYQYMFYGCTSLTSAPQLPATTLAASCYQYMFYGCTSLTSAPQLPATTLVYGCYTAMFRDCTSLTTAPQLPATTLANSCYTTMFQDCTSLQVSGTQTTEAPHAWTLPTTGTFTNTYSQSGMFTGCLGTRSSNNMPGQKGRSYTYYTQNEPI